MKKKINGKAPKKHTRRSREKETNIIEGALRVFGEKGFEETTISLSARQPTYPMQPFMSIFHPRKKSCFPYHNFIPNVNLIASRRSVDLFNVQKIRMRGIIQAYLEFYEKNRLYTSVVMLSLKGNRNFLKSEAYKIIREASRTIVDTFSEGVQKGIFRDDIDPYLFRNMVLGFIEHLTIQWLLVERPASITEYRDQIFDMCMRAVLKNNDPDSLDLKCQTLNITITKE